MRKTALFVTLLAFGACEKGQDKPDKQKEQPAEAADPSAPGIASASADAWGYLPGDAQLIFAADYNGFMEYWETSPLRKLSEGVNAKLSKDSQDKVREYTTCWVERDKNTKLYGSLSFSQELWLDMVWEGVSKETIAACAKKGGFKLKTDGKYIEIEGLSGGLGGGNFAYFQLGPNTLYFATQIPLSGEPKPTSKSDFEARIASAKKSPASKSSRIKGLMKKVDANRSMWFAGTATGTPVAAVLKDVHGHIDTTKESISFAFEAELGSVGAASEAVKAWNSAKNQLSMMPSNIQEAAKDFMDEATLSAKGKILKGNFRLTNKMLKKALPTLEAFTSGL